MFRRKIKISIVGNCQGRPLADLLKRLCSRVDVVCVAIVHLVNDEVADQYLPFFEQSDFIFAQLVQDSYPCEFVRTAALKGQYPDKVISFVNLYYQGFSPSWRYLRVPGEPMLKGPMDDYHCSTILDCWKRGLDIQETTRIINDREFNKAQYSDVISSSLEELRRREQASDCRIVDEIQDRERNEHLFFTFNHPKLVLLELMLRSIEQVRDIFDNRNCLVSLSSNREPLDKVILPINCASPHFDTIDCLSQVIKGLEIGSDGKARSRVKYYRLDQLVESFFTVYDSNHLYLNRVGI